MAALCKRRGLAAQPQLALTLFQLIGPLFTPLTCDFVSASYGTTRAVPPRIGFSRPLESPRQGCYGSRPYIRDHLAAQAATSDFRVPLLSRR